MGAGTPSAPSCTAPRQHPLTVPQVEVVGCPSRPQAHGVDSVVHVPGHRGIVRQRQHHLEHRQAAGAGLCPRLASPPPYRSSPIPTDPPAGVSSGLHPPARGWMCGDMLGTRSPFPRDPPAPPSGWCLPAALRGWREPCEGQEKLNLSRHVGLRIAHRPAGGACGHFRGWLQMWNSKTCPYPYVQLLPSLFRHCLFHASEAASPARPSPAGMLAGPLPGVQPASESPPGDRTSHARGGVPRTPASRGCAPARTWVSTHLAPVAVCSTRP